MAKTKTRVFEKKNFDNNSLQNLYMSFFTSWSLRPHKPNKNNPKKYNSNSRKNYPKMEELGSP